MGRAYAGRVAGGALAVWLSACSGSISSSDPLVPGAPNSNNGYNAPGSPGANGSGGTTAMNGGNAGIGPLMGIDKDGDGKPDDVVPGVVEALTCKTKAVVRRRCAG